jgi:hypothetical protein
MIFYHMHHYHYAATGDMVKFHSYSNYRAYNINYGVFQQTETQEKNPKKLRVAQGRKQSHGQ